jgi:hypothetical protein
MILKFWKSRKAKAIERRRDELLAVVRKGRSMCENVDYRYVSEDDRQANSEAVDLFELLEIDLETAETHDEMMNAVKQAKALVDSHWFRHLKAGSEP